MSRLLATTEEDIMQAEHVQPTGLWWLEPQAGAEDQRRQARNIGSDSGQAVAITCTDGKQVIGHAAYIPTCKAGEVKCPIDARIVNLMLDFAHACHPLSVPCADAKAMVANGRFFGFKRMAESIAFANLLDRHLQFLYMSERTAQGLVGLLGQLEISREDGSAYARVLGAMQQFEGGETEQALASLSPKDGTDVGQLVPLWTLYGAMCIWSDDRAHTARGIELLGDAAEAGHGPARVWLGRHQKTQGNRAAAIAHFEVAAAQRVAAGEAELALLLMEEDGRRAQGLFQRAIENTGPFKQMDHVANTQIGIGLFGQGSYVDAFPRLSESALFGYPEGLVCLGRSLLFGLGTKKSLESAKSALEKFRIAKERGSLAGKFYWGHVGKQLAAKEAAELAAQERAQGPLMEASPALMAVSASIHKDMVAAYEAAEEEALTAGYQPPERWDGDGGCTIL